MPKSRSKSRSRHRSRSRSRSGSRKHGGGKLGPNEYRCMKCRKSVTVPLAETHIKKTKNGRSRRVGKCHTCGTEVGKFVKA